MASEPTFESNRDIFHATLEKFMIDEPPLNYAYETYEDMSIWFHPNIMQVTGDELKGFITTGTVGNAGAKNPWAKDSIVVKNITKEYSIDPFKHYNGAMAFNKMNVSANSGAEKIFDVVKHQYRKARAELIDSVRLAVWTGPTSADDTLSMHGIPSWLALGTQLSTGGYTGYKARYNDGSTPGTAFNKGGLNSTASVNPEMANFYIDHQGNLDETLLKYVTSACRRLNFKPPVEVPDPVLARVNKYACFTTENVMDTLNLLYIRLNSNVGPNPGGVGYFKLSAIPLPGSIKLAWVDILDDGNVSLYGTDPIFGVNMNVLYPTYLSGWNMTLTENDNSDRHLVGQKFIDCGYQTWCDVPSKAGFLISNHPSN
jgi:hypothetical protein